MIPRDSHILPEDCDIERAIAYVMGGLSDAEWADEMIDAFACAAATYGEPRRLVAPNDGSIALCNALNERAVAEYAQATRLQSALRAAVRLGDPTTIGQLMLEIWRRRELAITEGRYSEHGREGIEYVDPDRLAEDRADRPY